MQNVVKHLIENPKEIESFKKDPSTFLKGITGLTFGLDEILRVNNILSEFDVFRRGGIHLNHWNGPMHTDKHSNISTQDPYDRFREILILLRDDPKKIADFQLNPSQYFEKYKIDANKELSTIIIDSVKAT